MIPDSVPRWLRAHDYGEMQAVHTVAGGCINRGVRLVTSNGQSFFLKTNSAAPADMFLREAEGLEALRVPRGPRVPRPLVHGEDFLLMEDLSPAGQSHNYWTRFGSQLAALHEQPADRFGFAHDNYIGSTVQTNSWTSDGYEFFGQQRLLFQAGLAHSRGYLRTEDVERIDRIAAKLRELVPEQPASLIHGDLWSGNAITDEQGSPALIDPATHYGWAEAELAMTALFGIFPESFYHSYEHVRPLEPGYRARFPLYNLYHLLNHLNLFGRSYLPQVQSVIKKFS